MVDWSGPSERGGKGQKSSHTWTSHTSRLPSTDAVAAYGMTSQKRTASTEAVCAASVPVTCAAGVRATTASSGKARPCLAGREVHQLRAAVLRAGDCSAVGGVHVQARDGALVKAKALQEQGSAGGTAGGSAKGVVGTSGRAPGRAACTRRSAGSTAAGCDVRWGTVRAAGWGKAVTQAHLASAEAVHTLRPSGVNAPQETAPLWPANTCAGRVNC